MKDLQGRITSIIKELGIPANVRGFHYVRYAIALMVQDITIMNAFVKNVYKAVAKEFNTTPLRAERAIRHAIETGWDRANAEFANKLFGYSVDKNKGRPTNSEFVVTVADYILMEQDRPAEKGGGR